MTAPIIFGSKGIGVERDRTLLQRYRLMVVMRKFEEACAEGVTTGELRGELHLANGQEAIAAGMAGTLRPQDWVVSTHRSHMDAIAKGVELGPMMAEIYEKATGLCHGKGGHMHLFDMENRFSSTGIVGAALPVAAGHAYAARLAGSDEIAVGVTGDGGTNIGAFHETMNMAAIWRLPLVILAVNNFYGISVPAEAVLAGGGIAERAAAYGVRGQRVDGTDVEAVAAAFRDAADHARSGAGPVLLEATCFRFRGHYEGDLDHYRTAAQKEAMVDPLVVARSRLLAGGTADEDMLRSLETEAEKEISAILAQVRRAPDPDPTNAHTDVFMEAIS